MSTEAEEFLENLNTLCRGNATAMEFCQLILEMVATYDDVIDKDVPVPELDIHRMMWFALVQLPRNKFYHENFNLLNPLIMNSIMNWRIANEMEKEKSGEDLNIAFIIRSSYVDIFRMVAHIIGGDVYAVDAGIALRRYVHDETLAAYLVEQRGVIAEGD